MDAINCSLSRCYDYQSTKTSAFDFLLALQAFLGHNQIETIGPFRMRVEPTKNNNWTLFIEGEASLSNRDAFDQAALGFPWPPTPPELDNSTYEIGTAESNSVTSSSGSFLARPMSMESNDLETPISNQILHLPSITVDSHSPLFAGREESDALSATLFDDTLATAVDTQDSPTEHFAFGHTRAPLEFHSYTASKLSAFESSTSMNTSSSTAGQKRSHVAHQGSPVSTPTRRRASVTKKQKIKLDSSETETELIVRHLSQNMTCENCYGLLDSMLPRWVQRGIWHEHENRILSGPTGTDLHLAPSPYFKLEQAYRVVCQIDSRMSDDLVRDRVGLIQLHLEYTETHRVRRRSSASDRTTSTVGRGDASHVIDRILENIHDEWAEMDQTRRAELRAKFHERKKYGKRWYQLANALGPGILLICSTKLASTVRGTTVTAKMLDSAIERFKMLDPGMVKVIGIVSPLAACLLRNEGYRDFEAMSILRQLQSVLLEAP
ncbi:hypothetical protein BDV06DRAFT_225080 [Aspergillus oleicola]